MISTKFCLYPNVHRHLMHVTMMHIWEAVGFPYLCKPQPQPKQQGKAFVLFCLFPASSKAYYFLCLLSSMLLITCSFYAWLLALFFQSTLTGQIDLTVDGGAEQSAVSDHEDDDCVDQHFPMPSSILGVNSPRKRPETAKCWNVIKRSRSSENTLVWARKWFNKGKEFTHVYIHDIEEDVRGGIVCNTPLRLHRFAKGANTKVSWVTTHATKHISRLVSQVSWCGRWSWEEGERSPNWSNISHAWVQGGACTKNI